MMKEQGYKVEKTIVRVLIAIALTALLLFTISVGAKVYIKYRNPPIEWRRTSPRS